MYTTDGMPCSEDERWVFHEDVVELGPEFRAEEFFIYLSFIEDEDWRGRCWNRAVEVLAKEGESGHASEDVCVDEELGRGGGYVRCDGVELRDGIAAGVIE